MLLESDIELTEAACPPEYVTVPTYGTPLVALGGEMAMLDALEIAWNPKKATVPVVILRIIAELHGAHA
jgi:hypothetical protein